MTYNKYHTSVINKCKKAGISINLLDSSDIETVDGVIDDGYEQGDSTKETADIVIDECKRCFG